MSQQYPGPEGPDGDVDYLGEAPEKPGGRRWTLIAGGTAVVVVLGAVGAWGLAQFLGGGGASPASAVPADALAYVALDLDPSGSQKLEAYQTLKKFPALKDKLGLNSADDLRKNLVEALLTDAPCDLDFDADIDPWLGSRVGLGVAPGEDEPTLFGVLQVKDQQKATAGIAKLAACDDPAGDDGSTDDNGDSKAAGTAFVDDYVVVAETQAQADKIAADASEASLADDGDYQKWVGEAGGAGILTAYVAAGGPSALLGSVDESLPGSEATEPAKKVFADFTGAAAAVRFDDGALEIESAAGGLPGLTDAGQVQIGDLPASTAVGYGFAVDDNLVDDTVEQLGLLLGKSEVDQGLAELKSDTGLTQDDLQTLLGDGVGVALDSSADLGSLFSFGEGGNTTSIPAGIRITGDPDAIRPVVQKVLDASGAAGGQVVVEEGDGVVAIGVDPDYVKTLAGNGSLGDGEAFGAALPEVDRSSGAVYVDFDAGDWLTGLFQGDEDAADLRANLEPLRSFGASSWADGDILHGLARLTTG